MKTLFLLLLSTLMSPSQTIWQTRMIQDQIGGASGIPELVDDEGERPSLPIGAQGSRFELWGWKIVDGVIASEVLLNSAEVGTYKPEATIAISSGDPYQGFHRTRVDQPFTVTYQISNLMPASPNTPEAATKVYVEHYADLYQRDSYDGRAIESTNLVRSFYLDQNGPHSFSFPFTNVTAADLARRSGRETFIVYALADAARPQREIARSEIVFFPISEGSLSRLDTDTIYKTLPTFEAGVWRSYPNSSTWVEMYQGSYIPKKRGIPLSSTLETPGHIYPDYYSKLEFETFPSEIQPAEQGKVTVVLLASSPFPGESPDEGGRMLAWTTINTKNTISVRANLVSME